MNVYVALLHFPVYNKNKEVVTTCVTGFDLHDIARSCKTYGIKKYFVVNPISAQRQFAERVLSRWMEEDSQEFNPTRVEAFNLVSIKKDLKEVIEEISGKNGSPVVVATSARQKGSYTFGKLRDEILNREIFYSVMEAKVIVENWRLEYNNLRPHSGLGYKSPAEFALSCIAFASPTAQRKQYTGEQACNSLIEAGT